MDRAAARHHQSLDGARHQNIVSLAVSILRLVLGCFLFKSNDKVIEVYLDSKPHRHLGTHDCVYIVSPAVSTMRLV